jgi:hypothetical protein
MKSVDANEEACRIQKGTFRSAEYYANSAASADKSFGDTL